MRGLAFLLSGLLVLALQGQSARAHALDLTTARVSLRDTHVEVIVELDLSRLFSKAPTELAALPDSELAAQIEQTKRRLESQTRLHSDGKPLRVVVSGFPSREDLRAMVVAASASTVENGELHGPRLRIRLESPSSVDESRQLAIGLPVTLGPVVATFLQPSTRYLPAGGIAAFAVLATPGAPPHPARFAVPWLASGLAAACLWLAWRRRSPTVTPAVCPLPPRLFAAPPIDPEASPPAGPCRS